MGYSPKTNVRQVDGYSILEFANAGSLYDIIEDISTVFINIEENYENLSFIFNDIFVQVLKHYKYSNNQNIHLFMVI